MKVEQTDRDAAQVWQEAFAEWAMQPSDSDVGDKAASRVIADFAKAAEQRGREEGERIGYDRAIAEVVAWLRAEADRYSISGDARHILMARADAIEARQRKASERP